MTKNLIIVGAGNVGGYIAYNLHDFGDYNLLGFIDDNPLKHGTTLYNYNVLGGMDVLNSYSHPNINIAIGIASPVAKASVLGRIKRDTFVFPNFISPRAWISNGVQLGRSVIIYPGVSINYETKIGNNVIINMNCAIGHNCEIGDLSSLAPGVNLAGFTVLEEGVDMGIGSCTKQAIRVGSYATVGGQSMLIQNIGRKSLVAGVPAKQIKTGEK